MRQIGLTVHSIFFNWYRTRAPKQNLFQKIKCFPEKDVNCDVLPCCLNLSHKIYENILEQMSYKKQMSEHLFLAFERFCQYDIQILLAYIENVPNKFTTKCAIWQACEIAWNIFIFCQKSFPSSLLVLFLDGGTFILLHLDAQSLFEPTNNK